MASKSKRSAAVSGDETLCAERGAEAGADFALYNDLDLEEAVETIRAEAKARVANTGMTESERKAYARAFIAAASEALGV